MKMISLRTARNPLNQVVLPLRLRELQERAKVYILVLYSVVNISVVSLILILYRLDSNNEANLLTEDKRKGILYFITMSQQYRNDFDDLLMLHTFIMDLLYSSQARTEKY